MSERNRGPTDKDDIVSLSLLKGYMENGGQGLKIAGATYHASPLINKSLPDDDIVREIQNENMFPVYEAATVGDEVSDSVCNSARGQAGSSVNMLANAIKNSSPQNPLYVLNWSPMTEVACVMQGLDPGYYANVVVLSHWTNPNQRAIHNCNKDVEACRYMHFDLPPGFKLLEFGDSGEDQLVNECMDQASRYNALKSIVDMKHAGVKRGGKDVSDTITALAVAKYQNNICQRFKCDGSDQAAAIRSEACSLADDFFALKGNSVAKALIPMRSSGSFKTVEQPKTFTLEGLNEGNVEAQSTQDSLSQAEEGPAAGDFFIQGGSRKVTLGGWKQPLSGNENRDQIRNMRQDARKEAQKMAEKTGKSLDEHFEVANAANDWTFRVRY